MLYSQFSSFQSKNTAASATRGTRKIYFYWEKEPNEQFMVCGKFWCISFIWARHFCKCDSLAFSEPVKLEKWWKIATSGPKKAKNLNQKIPHTQKKDMQKILPQIKIGSFSQEEIVFPVKIRHFFNNGISYAFRDTMRRVRG